LERESPRTLQRQPPEPYSVSPCGTLERQSPHLGASVPRTLERQSPSTLEHQSPAPCIVSARAVV